GPQARRALTSHRARPDRHLPRPGRLAHHPLIAPPDAGRVEVRMSLAADPDAAADRPGPGAPADASDPKAPTGQPQPDDAPGPGDGSVAGNPVVLQVRDLRKRFGEIEAVRGVSFEIHEGETYGLLGPNGAGKTTTISMVCGLLARDGGEVTLDSARIDV